MVHVRVRAAVDARSDLSLMRYGLYTVHYVVHVEICFTSRVTVVYRGIHVVYDTLYYRMAELRLSAKERERKRRLCGEFQLTLHHTDAFILYVRSTVYRYTYSLSIDYTASGSAACCAQRPAVC